MKFNYWEVLNGNCYSNGDCYYCCMEQVNNIKGVTTIFKNRLSGQYSWFCDIYLEDYFSDIDNPTLTELSLFELSTGITLELPDNKDSGESCE